MKYFYLPGYYRFYNEFKILDEFIDKYPNYFIEDRVIAGAYDLPSGLIWNGGRVEYTSQKFNLFQTAKVMRYFHNKKNFILLHVCTNFFIENELLYDKKCNDFFDTYLRSQDKIIIASPSLKAYLNKKYQNCQFINSTTLGIIDLDKVNELSKNEVYVLYYGKNADNNYLSQLLYKDNIEILCAELCVPNCPYRDKHYEIMSQAALGDIEILKTFTDCPADRNDRTSISKLIHTHNYMVPNKRIDELDNMGFHHFKISGRLLSPIEWFEILVYYLVKPEYQAEVHFTLCKDWSKIYGKDYKW